MQMTLKHMDIALERASEINARGDALLELFAARWKAARAPDDRLAILAIRSALLDYLAACHVLGNTEQFRTVSNALLDHAEAFAKKFKPATEILLVELSLAVLSKRRALARSLAKVVLNTGNSIGCVTLNSFQAQALARLLDLDYAGVHVVATGLWEAGAAKRFNKITHKRALFWAEAIDELAKGHGEEAATQSEQIQQLNINSVDRDLAKLKRGGASAFAPFDMFDLPTAALNTLIEAFGYRLPPLSEAALACGYGLGLNQHKQQAG